MRKPKVFFVKQFAIRILLFVLALLFAVPPLFIGINAEENNAVPEAGSVAIKSISGLSNYRNALNDNYKNSASTSGTVSVTFEEPVSVLYLIFVDVPGNWTLKANGTDYVCGTHAFLEEVVDLRKLSSDASASADSFVLEFQGQVNIVKLAAFGDGKLPDFVHEWDDPCTKADLLLFSSHADDEQLFFAGLLPYYSVVRDCAVQVAYATDHVSTKYRRYELLEGLWCAGIRHYPVISDFPDYYSESREQAANQLKYLGFSQNEFLEWQKAVILRFSPQVIVTHDVNGEYGHGMHKLVSFGVQTVVDEMKDQLPELKKVYLHLYDQNKISLSVIDEPSDRLGGKTPFQVTQESFQYHQSQHYTWFYDWIYYGSRTPKTTVKITAAKQITIYSPLDFGLYYSSVEPDTEKKDFFEHLTTYAEAERQAEEERLRKEEESRAAEEESRRLEEEELRRLEEESRRVRAEQESVSRRLYEESSDVGQNQTTERKVPSYVWIILSLSCFAACIAVLVYFIPEKPTNRKK